MFEAKAPVALPSFSHGFAKSQCEAGTEMLTPKKGTISKWPEVVQYLLYNYVQSSKIRFAAADLRAVLLKPIDMEEELTTKLIQSICRCGKVYPLDEALMTYIDALDVTNSLVVARYR